MIRAGDYELMAVSVLRLLPFVEKAVPVVSLGVVVKRRVISREVTGNADYGSPW